MASVRNSEYQPDFVTPPGGTLQDILDEKEMSQAELACRTGLTSKHISNIVNGKAGITADVALTLERVLSVPARFWLSREARYREYKAREAERKRLISETEWIQNFPIREMERLGYIEKGDNKLSKLTTVLNFFGLASPGEFTDWLNSVQPSFRISSKNKPDFHALAAWLRRGELVAARIDCAPFDKERFQKTLIEIRSLTSESPTVFQPRLIELCSQCGVAVAFVPELPNSYVSGATRWLSENKALIQLSLRYKTADMLWFAFFHEACHVLKHPKRAVFMRFEKCDSRSQEEIEADEFAANVLIPPKEYRAFARHTVTEREIIDLSARLGIDPSIVVGRLQHDKYIAYNSRLTKLKKRYSWHIE